MNFSKPTASSSMSHTAAGVPLKTSNSVKESNNTNTGSTKEGGFLSHTATRATGKKGFFGRDSNDTGA